MKGHSRLPARAWMLPIGVAALIAAHVLLPYLLSRQGFLSHATLPVGLVSVVAVLVAVKHLGLLGSAFALLRRRSQRREHREHVAAVRNRNLANEERGAKDGGASAM